MVHHVEHIPVRVTVLRCHQALQYSPSGDFDEAVFFRVESVCCCALQSEGEAPGLLDGMGRVTYEQSGETFFLPFALEDIDGGQKITAGDTVEFYISTDER